MKHNIRIHKEGNIIFKKAETGTNLLKFLRDEQYKFETPCNGNGTCGKCRIKADISDNPATEREKKLLGEEALNKGYRLACYININSDIDLFYEDRDDIGAKILTDAKQREIFLAPSVSKRLIQLNTPDLEDQLPDLDRVEVGAGINVMESLHFLRMLPKTLREGNFEATLVCYENTVSTIEEGNTTGKFYGIAVDIGTTTVAGYLYDLNTGNRLDVNSILNPQGKFGADVLSRTEYTMNSKSGLEEMNMEIINCINNIVKSFVEKNAIAPEDIYAITFAGNTVMMHFLLMLTAENIAVSPFIPVTTKLHRFKAKELGININDSGYAIILPSISGYVGADTVAATLSSGMYNNNEVSLLLDIGTNGEIVLGNNEWLYCCSAAAGPAFEGANIRNGIGGVAGAIDRVNFTPDFSYTTIGNKKAVGICGSGIVDIIAGMLESELIDETGRLVSDEDASGLPEELGKRLIEVDGMRAFLLSKGEENAIGMDIAITQKDIRELQNAKAAIAAGIKTLVKFADIKMDRIKKVYLAGGFGSYIDINSAVKIGLITKELQNKVESIGNAAGAGAVECLLCSDMLKKTEEIRKSMKYIELSAMPEFVNEYVECMMFEE